MTRTKVLPIDRTNVALMGIEAASLAVMSPLHLSHVLNGGVDAGVAEALIFLALAIGIGALLRRAPSGEAIAAGAVSFAIVGFLVGLSSTIHSGGDAYGIGYHATVLPLLVLTLLRLRRRLNRLSEPDLGASASILDNSGDPGAAMRPRDPGRNTHPLSGA